MKPKKLKLNKKQKKLCKEYGTQSPIETILYLSLKSRIPNTVEITPQAKIEKYFVDFLIKYKNKILIVECDGKDWHTSPEQIAYDEIRTDQLKALGYDNIMRFTGSEISNQLLQCVYKIKQFFNIPINYEIEEVNTKSSKDSRKLEKKIKHKLRNQQRKHGKSILTPEQAAQRKEILDLKISSKEIPRYGFKITPKY